jgi:hypothetical protein
MKINTVKNKLLEAKTSPQQTLKTGKSASTINQHFSYQHKNNTIEKAISEAENKKTAIINTLNRYTLR